MWRDNYPDQAVFPKLHVAVWHVLEFVEEFGAYAVFSEEAFESCHNLQKKEHSNVSSMKDNGQRLGVFCRRLQSHINAKFEEAYIRLKQRVTGKKRGKYAPSKKKQSTDLPSLDSEAKEEDGVIYINEEVAIKKEWEEVYRLVVQGKVPESWNHVFVKRVNIDDKKTQYTQNS